MDNHLQKGLKVYFGIMWIFIALVLLVALYGATIALVIWHGMIFTESIGVAIFITCLMIDPVIYYFFYSLIGKYTVPFFMVWFPLVTGISAASYTPSCFAIVDMSVAFWLFVAADAALVVLVLAGKKTGVNR